MSESLFDEISEDVSSLLDDIFSALVYGLDPDFEMEDYL